MTKRSSSVSILRILGLTAGAFALFIIVAILQPWKIAQEEAPLGVVRVGYLPIYSDLPLFVAVERGYFKARGIDVELVRLQSSPDLAAALVQGQIDAAASVATASALAIETRDPGRFRIFMVDAETPSQPLSSLIVRENSPVNNIADLNGKLIASFPGPTAKIFAPLALAKLGLEVGSYRLQEMDIGTHIAALQSGQVDAVITYEPTATQAVVKYHARKLVPGLIESQVMNPWQAGVWIISSGLLTQKGDSANAFALAIYDALDLLRASPDDAKSALSKYTSIDSEIAKETPNIPFTKVNEVNVGALQRHADLLTSEGVLSKSLDVSALLANISP